LTDHLELIQFIALHAFDRMAEGMLDDEHIRLIQSLLQDTPDAGDVIQGTGGLRKLRIRADGRGKRGGGGRLLYLYVQVRGVIYFTAVFAKSAQENLTRADYRVLAELVERLKKEG
jgi:hypothetical protein